MDDDRADKNNDGDDNDNESLQTNEDMSLMSEEDWADHSSVTTDEEPANPPTKKNIHSRRWTLVPKDDGSFIIEGGRKPKTIDKSTRSWSIKLNKHLADADIIMCVANLPPSFYIDTRIKDPSILEQKLTSEPYPQTASNAPQTTRPQRTCLSWPLL